jgi:hypothetical protein
MHDLIELAHALAWPATVLIVLFVLRAELRNFMKKLSDKVAEAASTSISLTTKGINIKLAAAHARVTALQATQEQAIPAKRRRKQKPTDPPKEEVGELREELEQLAQEYIRLDGVEDYKERVRRKNETAREMGDLVVSGNISRQALVESGSEAKFVALAAAIAAKPEADDVRLIVGSSHAKRLHVRYRLVVSLTILISRGLVGEKDKIDVEAALNRLSIAADAPLENVIAEAQSLLQEVLAGEVPTEL